MTMKYFLSTCVLVLNYFTLALSVCPSGWARRGSSCYYIFQEKFNRSEATSLCAAHSSSLVSFSDQGDWDYISNLVLTSHLDTGFWTGLALVRNSWQWEDSSPYKEQYHWQTPDKPSVNYIQYVPTPTNDLMWVKLINTATQVFLQLEANSTLLYPFCKRDIDARDLCDTNEQWVRLHAECYKLYPPSTWTDAVSTCHASSGHLIAPSRDSDLSSITSILSPNISIWVDATDSDSLGIFYTSDKNRVSYLPWLPDLDGGGYALNPNHTCALATFNHTQFGYKTQPCNVELPYVCKMPQGTCPLGWIQDGIDCYQLHIRPDEKVTWSGAMDHCGREGGLMIQYAITDRAKSMLHKELQDNDITLVWAGFSGTGPDFRYIENDVVREKIIPYDTTDITGMNTRCGVTDLSAQSVDLAVYCFTPRNFICIASLTDDVHEIPPSNLKCESGWTLGPYNNYCVKIMLTVSNFTDAQNACEKENASLFIINNEWDQNLFSTPMFLSEGIDYYWIGVQYDVNKSSYTLVKSTSQVYSPSEGACIYVKTGSLAPFIGAWVRDVCSSKHKFVCQKEGIQVVNPATSITTSWSPRCSVGWLFSSETNECYLVSAFTRKTWQEARYECTSQGGDLLSISGDREQSFIENLLKSNDYKHLEQPLWIGAKDVWNGHGWSWSDNKPFRYLHWGQAEPDYESVDGNNCGFMPVAKKFEWETRSCLEKLGFICKKNSLPEQNGEFPTQAPFKSCSPEPLISGQHSLQFSSSFSASSYLDESHRPEDSRIMSLTSDMDCQSFQFGTENCPKSRAWSPANDSIDEWLAIQFHSPVTITDILLKGEDSTDKYVTKFKLQYQYDDTSPWTWIIDSNRNVKIFDGVSSPDSSTSVFMIGDLQAQGIKIWPVEWSYGIAIQVELNGCLEDLCLYEYAMSGPLLVRDDQITASSSKTGKQPWNARLRPVQENQSLSYWIPETNDTTPWIQVDFGKDRIIGGLILLGDFISNNFVTKFQLQFSQACNISDFINYTEPYSVPKIFSALGVNRQSPTTVYLKSSVKARVVRIVVIEKNFQAALKFDVLVCSIGCQAEPVITNKTDFKITASTSQISHTPERSELNAESNGWKPLTDKEADSSFIMVDFGTVMSVAAVATRGSETENSWVRSYYLAYSTDGQSFTRYGGNITNFVHSHEEVHFNNSVLFAGNFDGSTVVKNELSPPVSTRYVQLWPHDFHSSITLRWEVYTCPAPNDTPLGCYSDEISDPDLPYVPIQDSFASVSPASCVAHCYRQGYHYAGVENGTKCSCGNTYGMYGKSDDCSVLCNEPYSDSVCGGESSNLVYSTGLGLSSLVCPDGWFSLRDHCYMIFVFNVTWSAANYACGNLSANLVDIQDEGENKFVTSLLDDIVHFAWTGLSDNRKSLTFEWFSQAPVTYTSWGPHQPSVNFGLYHQSVTISQSGSWRTVPVENMFPFICKMNKIQSLEPVNNRQDPGCPQGWTAYKTKCIQVNRLKNSWHGAKSLCELDGTTLLHIESSQENDFVSSLLTRPDGQFWVDILDSNSSGLYQHSSGSVDVSFTNWGVGKPDSLGQCVSINSGYLAGMWSNGACDTKFRFLCQQPINLTTSTTSGNASQQPTTQSTLQCTSGWLDAGDGSCYQINTNSSKTSQLTWQEASDDCKKKGADLASFHSSTSLNYIVETLRKLPPATGNMWIGLNDFDQSAGFTWTDGSVMNFMKWGDSQPSTNKDYMCGELLTVTGRIGLQSCSQLKYWICSIEKGKSAVTVPDKVFPHPDKDGNCPMSPDVWLKYNDSCYYVSDGQGAADRSLTWRESREWCGMRGADLASVNSEDENLFLQGLLIYGIPARAVWIGLNELDRNSGYSWSDGSPVGIWGLNWNVNEPNDENGFEACVELLARNGKWNDQNCAKHQGFICEKPTMGANSSYHPPPARPDGNCPDQFVKFGQKCFRVMGLDSAIGRLSWKDAYTSCRTMKVYGSNNYSVELASISSILENVFITTLLANNKRSAWIGLRKHIGGQLYWSDNEDLSFENWNRGEPSMPSTDESCIFIDGSSSSAGKWGDERCDQQMAYVCQGFT
ncbi:hypothetical protein Btru_055548, partial [Bulinus truncatus]